MKLLKTCRGRKHSKKVLNASWFVSRIKKNQEKIALLFLLTYFERSLNFLTQTPPTIQPKKKQKSSKCPKNATTTLPRLEPTTRFTITTIWSMRQIFDRRLRHRSQPLSLLSFRSNSQELQETRGFFPIF